MNTGLTFTAMLPEHLLLLGIVLLLVLEIAGVAKRSALVVAIAAVAASGGAALWLVYTGFSGSPFPGQFSVAHDSLVAKTIVMGLTLPVLLMSRDDFDGSEFPALLLSSLYGVCLLISSDSYLTMFLGLELMSLPVYTLVLLAYRRVQSAEAALKYLVLGGAATAMFLMGVSLLFGISGSTSISTFSTALLAPDIMSRAAVALILLAFFLKGAVVPFHAWAPDAYECASVPVTAYMSTLVKAGVMFGVLRLFASVPVVSPILEIIAVFPLISIVWGNIAAMRQQSFRRMMGYSSIAHAGYMFYALLGAGEGRMQAITFYLLTYGALNLLAFAALPNNPDDASRDRMDTLKGLWHRNPFSAAMIAIAMLSLSGLPPFPGFVAKFLIFKNVLAAGYTTYAVIGLVGSYIGIYFYLRVIQMMFMSASSPSHTSRVDDVHVGLVVAPEVGTPVAVYRTSAFAHFAAMLCLAATLVLMFLPGWVLEKM